MKARNTVKASQGVMTKPVKQNHIEHNEFIDALTGLNHFVWDLAELAMEAAKLPSKVFSFKLLKNANVLIFDATVFIARELSAGKDINAVLSGVIPELGKVVANEAFVNKVTQFVSKYGKYGPVLFQKVGARYIGNFIGEIFFSDPLNPVETASIKRTVLQKQRMASLSKKEYEDLVKKSVEISNAAVNKAKKNALAKNIHAKQPAKKSAPPVVKPRVAPKAAPNAPKVAAKATVKPVPAKTAVKAAPAKAAPTTAPAINSTLGIQGAMNRHMNASMQAQANQALAQMNQSNAAKNGNTFSSLEPHIPDGFHGSAFKLHNPWGENVFAGHVGDPIRPPRGGGRSGGSGTSHAEHGGGAGGAVARPSHLDCLSLPTQTRGIGMISPGEQAHTGYAQGLYCRPIGSDTGYTRYNNESQWRSDYSSFHPGVGAGFSSGFKR